MPAAQLLDAVRHVDAIRVGDGVHWIVRLQAWDTIDQATGTSLNQAWATLPELRAWRRDLARAAKTACFTTSVNPRKQPEPPCQSSNLYSPGAKLGSSAWNAGGPGLASSRGSAPA